MKYVIALLTLALLAGCNNGTADQMKYNGRLEADIIRISAQTAGTVESVTVDEGQQVKAGTELALLNTDKLQLQLQQQKIQLDELELNRKLLAAQGIELQAQLNLARNTLEKTKKMAAGGAATTQSIDELTTQVTVLEAKQSALNIQRQTLQNKQQQLQAAVQLTLLTLNDAHIKAASSGTILNRFINPGELCAPGTPLFEIADLGRLEASIYVPQKVLTSIQLNQAVEVYVDGRDSSLPARVQWVSAQSEFTPKTILTEETRTTLVYRVKISVDNADGLLKIGMPVDVVLGNTSEEMEAAQ